MDGQYRDTDLTYFTPNCTAHRALHRFNCSLFFASNRELYQLWIISKFNFLWFNLWISLFNGGNCYLMVLDADSRYILPSQGSKLQIHSWPPKCEKSSLHIKKIGRSFVYTIYIIHDHRVQESSLEPVRSDIFLLLSNFYRKTGKISLLPVSSVVSGYITRLILFISFCCFGNV